MLTVIMMNTQFDRTELLSLGGLNLLIFDKQEKKLNMCGDGTSALLHTLADHKPYWCTLCTATHN